MADLYYQRRKKIRGRIRESLLVNETQEYPCSRGHTDTLFERRKVYTVITIHSINAMVIA